MTVILVVVNLAYSQTEPAKPTGAPSRIDEEDSRMANHLTSRIRPDDDLLAFLKGL